LVIELLYTSLFMSCQDGLPTKAHPKIASSELLNMQLSMMMYRAPSMVLLPQEERWIVPHSLRAGPSALVQVSSASTLNASTSFLLKANPLSWTPSKKRTELHHALCTLLTNVVVPLVETRGRWPPRHVDEALRLWHEAVLKLRTQLSQWVDKHSKHIMVGTCAAGGGEKLVLVLVAFSAGCPACMSCTSCTIGHDKCVTLALAFALDNIVRQDICSCQRHSCIERVPLWKRVRFSKARLYVSAPLKMAMFQACWACWCRWGTPW
jgi:hypothetical protein